MRRRAPEAAAALCLAAALGAVAISDDGCSLGSRWVMVSSGGASHSSPVLALAFVNDRSGWAATPAGLLESSDGGMNWRPSPAGENVSVGFVTFIDADRGWAVGAEVGRRDVGVVLRTLDGAQHWTRHEVRAQGGLLTASFCDRDLGWAISSKEVVATSDGGTHWERRWEAQAEQSLISIACQDAQNAWVISSGGRLMHTADGGATWDAPTMGNHGNLYRIRVFDGRVWVTGEAGTLIYGDQVGKQFRTVATGSRAALLDIWMSDRDGWVVGSEGVILGTRDGGSTWDPVVSPTSSDLGTLFFLNSSVGWAAGRSMTVLRLRQ